MSAYLIRKYLICILNIYFLENMSYKTIVFDQMCKNGESLLFLKI